MTRVPGPTAVAVAALTASASFFTLLSWDGLSDDASGYLVPLFWVCAGVAAVGLVLRWFHVPVLLVPVVQLLVVALALHRGWAGDLAVGGWLPTGQSLRAVLDLFADGADAAAQHPAPVPDDETRFAPVMLGVGAVVVLLVDVLACTFRRVPLAGLPLLAAFTVPVAIVDGVPWPVFVAAATAFVLLLSAEHAARLSGWGSNISRMRRTDAGGRRRATRDTDERREVRLSTLWPRASRLGLAGVGIALLAPLLVPANSWWVGDGSGIGEGPGDVRVEDPFIDMQRNLDRDEERDLVRARTDDPDPSYLRLTVLDEFDGERWTRSERDLPEVNQADGSLPLPRGLSEDTPRTQQSWELTIDDGFTTDWLPTPYPATAIDVEGDWRWDESALDVQLYDDDLDVDGLTYEVEALRVEPDVERLVGASAPPLSISTPYTALPDELPQWVEDRAVDVTEGATSQFERAVMLQDWFRRPDNFTYSTERSPGSSMESLELFLGNGPGSRTGYCEQFAAAMTMMARTLNIPARIAIGFLRPDTTGDDEGLVFSSHDLHAWPELYFDGAGWVQFEPTPQDRARQVPSYTAGQIPDPPEVPTTSPSLTAEPSPSATPGRDERDAEGSTVAGGGVPAWLAALPVGALLVLAALAPRWFRGRRRRRRYAGPQPDALAEGSWAELRATALDLGLAWDDGATLRTRAASLAAWLRSSGTRPGRTGEEPRDPEPAVRALERLVLAVERSRYSRDGLGMEAARALPALADEVIAEMRAAASPRARRRAEWLPASLWRRGARTTGAPDADLAAEPERDQVSV